MKIALVNLFEFEEISEQLGKYRGGSRCPPIGLLALASSLRQRGHDVTLVDWVEPIATGKLAMDGRLTRSAAEYLSQFPSDVMGFTSRCDSYHYTLDVMRAFKAMSPSTPVILGGPQATITASATMERFPFVDMVVRHEGEETLPRLLQAVEGREALESIPGIAYRSAGKVQWTEEAAPIEDLDALPLAAFDLFPPFDGKASLEVGRGCPFACTFCSTSTFFRRSYRLKSAKKIVAEIRELQSRFNITKVSMVHDMMTANRKRMMELCDRLQEAALGVAWSCSARVDCVDGELLERMQRSGCEGIYFGIESGSPRVQRAIKKNLSLDLVVPAIKACVELGIDCTTSFMTGFPEEQAGDVEHTLVKALECARAGANSVQMHKLALHPGTPIIEKYRDKIVYTGYLSDVVASGAPRTAECEEMIRAVPEIFSEHYEMVSADELQELKGVEQFGVAVAYLKHTCFSLLAEGAFDSLLAMFSEFKRNGGVRRIDQLFWSDEPKRLRDAMILFCGELFARDQGKYRIAFEAFKYDLCSIRASWDKRELSPAASEVGRVRGRAVPWLQRDCAIATFCCDPAKLVSGVARASLESIQLSEVGTSLAIVGHKTSRGRAVVRRIVLNEAMREILARTDGERTVEDISLAIWESRAVHEKTESDCASLVRRSVARLASEGILGVAPDGARDGGDARSAGRGRLFDIDSELRAAGRARPRA